MLSFIEPIGILLVIGYFFYKIFELLVHRKERLNFINKVSEIQSLDKIQINELFAKKAQSSFGPLRLGSLLLGLGLGLLVGYAIIASCNFSCKYEEVVMLSTILIFGGLAMLICFLYELHLRKK